MSTRLRCCDRLERYYCEKYAKLIYGYIRDINSRNIYDLSIPFDIIQLLVLLYPIYVSCKVYAIGFNGYGEFGMGHKEQQNELTLCKWSNNIEIDHIYRGVITSIFKTVNNEFYITGSHKRYVEITKLKYFEENNINNIYKVCSGTFGHSIMWITRNGKLYCNGTNNFGLIDDNKKILEPVLIEYFCRNKLKVIDAASSSYFSIVVCENGNVYSCHRDKCQSGACGHGKQTECNKWKKIDCFDNINGEKINIIQVEVGSRHSLFVSDKGNVFSCGRNTRGQLGHGFIDKYDDLNVSPKKIEYFEINNIKIIKVSCGHAFNIALNKNGKVYTWGFGKFGQNGNGHTNDTHTPQIVNRLKNQTVIDIQCGAGFLCVLTINGDCFIWDKNDKNQCCNDKTEDVLL